ncbi:MAG: nuclear transport factor 2 family protein [Chloroflexota bacterium]
MKKVLVISSALLVLLAGVVAVAFAQGSGTVSVTNADTGAVSSNLVRQGTPWAVYNEHILALNACDWEALMAQYPNNVEIHLPDGVVVAGREDVGDLFAGFVNSFEDGGLCGLTFVEENRYTIGTTLNVQWVADAPFLARPYRGSDAYVTEDGLMVAQVTTFNGGDLVFKGDYSVNPVTNADTGDVSDTLVREETAVDVYEEHIRVLNACDWEGLMAQYPDQVEIHLPDGVVVQGRQAVGELFAGFVRAPEDGGLCGLTFVEESRFEVAGVLNVQWVADADFLAEPYRGSDAYVTDDGLMVVQVTTFNGGDLVFAPAEEE